MAINNSIALASKYLALLDEVYKKASCTSVLDATAGRVQFTGANTGLVYKTSMAGLGNYSRNSGFVDGDVTGAWEQFTLSKDRGRSFMIDAMDNEETMNMAFSTLAGEFMRTRVVPELDAYRFSKLAGTSGISAATAADIGSSTNVASLIDAGLLKMGNDEVPDEGKILFISEDAYANLKGNIARTTMNGDGNYSNDILTYEGMRVIRVPQNRFNTAITLYDGSTSGQTDGGYIVPASSSYKINFMIVHPSAVIQIVKHAMPRIFTPEVNQKADAYKFDYRVYHDIFVEANKVAGIYLHRASTANS